MGIEFIYLPIKQILGSALPVHTRQVAYPSHYILMAYTQEYHLESQILNYSFSPLYKLVFVLTLFRNTSQPIRSLVAKTRK